jgi:hypothetical protein
MMDDIKRIVMSRYAVSGTCIDKSRTPVAYEARNVFTYLLYTTGRKQTRISLALELGVSYATIKRRIAWVEGRMREDADFGARIRQIRDGLISKYRRGIFRRELRTRYEKACGEYLAWFCDQMGMERGDWVGGHAGGVACVGDYFIGMDDIMTAVDNDLSFDEFLEWYDYCLIVGRGSPNLRSWVDGCPRLSAEDLDKIEEARRLIRELEDGIGELVKKR